MDLMKALLGKDFANLRRYHIKVAPDQTYMPLKVICFYLELSKQNGWLRC